MEPNDLGVIQHCHLSTDLISHWHLHSVVSNEETVELRGSTFVRPGRSTIVSVRTLGEKIRRLIGSGEMPERG